MGKLILHVGDFERVPQGAEVLGTMTMTPAEMSDLGKGLKAPSDDRERHLFTNNDHILNGLRLAIIRGTLDPADLSIVYRSADEADVEQKLVINPSGTITNWPRGFFDQFTLDVMELGRFRRARPIQPEDQ